MDNFVTDIVGPWTEVLTRDIHYGVPMIPSRITGTTRIITNPDRGDDVIRSHYRQWKTILTQLLCAKYPTMNLGDAIGHAAMIYFLALLNHWKDPTHWFSTDLASSIALRFSLIDYPPHPEVTYSPSEMQLTIILGESSSLVFDHYLVNSNVASFSAVFPTTEIYRTINTSPLILPVTNRYHYLINRQSYDQFIYQLANQYYGETASG